MCVTCFKLFYIKDNSVGNSVDFKKEKHNGAPPPHPPPPPPPFNYHKHMHDIIYAYYYEL